VAHYRSRRDSSRAVTSDEALWSRAHLAARMMRLYPGGVRRPGYRGSGGEAMRTRMLSMVAVAMLALGAFASGAAAAKPKLWLESASSHAHAPTGDAARINFNLDSCSTSESASLLSNGKAVDHIGGTGALAASCGTGEKLAGAIKSIAVAPLGGAQISATVTGVIHLGVEPWCTYTLPSKFITEGVVFTETGGTVTAPLDKAASFGGCAPTREASFSLQVEQVSESFPYFVEAVG
jgi:hypothetical protein